MVVFGKGGTWGIPHRCVFRQMYMHAASRYPRRTSINIWSWAGTREISMVDFNFSLPAITTIPTKSQPISVHNLCLRMYHSSPPPFPTFYFFRTNYHPIKGNSRLLNIYTPTCSPIQTQQILHIPPRINPNPLGQPFRSPSSRRTPHPLTLCTPISTPHTQSTPHTTPKPTPSTLMSMLRSRI